VNNGQLLETPKPKEMEVGQLTMTLIDRFLLTIRGKVYAAASECSIWPEPEVIEASAMEEELIIL
jgi:hypothetical protein